MAVYMIRQGENGPVKIGHAKEPKKRLGGIQVGHHERLNILRLFVGDLKEERELHARFSDLHLRGEWFTFSEAMMGDVGLTPILPPPPPVAPGGQFAAAIDELTGIWRRHRGEAA